MFAHAGADHAIEPMLSGSDPAINDGVAAAATHVKRGNARRSAMIGRCDRRIGTIPHREISCRGVGGNRCGGRFPSGRIGYSASVVSVMPA